MFTRAQRDGIWELHLLAFKRMLPYCHIRPHKLSKMGECIPSGDEPASS